MSIEKRPDKKTGKIKYIARVYFGTRPDGTLDIRSKSFDREKDAKEHERKLESFKKGSIDRNISEKVIFGVVFQRYIEKQSITKKDNTIKNYKATYKKWIDRNLSHLKMENIKGSNINRFFNEIRRDGASEYVVNYVHILLFEIFKFATEGTEKYIIENPMMDLERPRLEYNPTVSIKFWSRKEADKVLEKAIGSEYYLAISLMINTGIRVSELSALTESSVDLGNKVLNVTGQIGPYEPKANEMKFEDEEVLVLGPTKNKAARSIPLNKNALESAKLAVKRNLDEQNYFLFYPDRKSKAHKVITKRGSSPHIVEAKLITAKTLGNAVKKFSELAGVPNIGPHGLRHTFAANFLMNGGDIFTLSRILGHKSITSTQIYSHLTQQFLKSALNIVEFGG